MNQKNAFTHTKARILYVDAHLDTRLMITLFLSQQGFGVVSASNHDEAVELVRQVKFDLFITELLLPEADGTELCRSLKELQPGVPTLYYTTLKFDDKKQEAMTKCGDYYLTKPVCFADFEAAINSLLFVKKESKDDEI